MNPDDEVIIRPKSLLVQKGQISLELILSEHGLCIFVGNGDDTTEILLDKQASRKIAQELQEEYL